MEVTFQIFKKYDYLFRKPPTVTLGVNERVKDHYVGFFLKDGSHIRWKGKKQKIKQMYEILTCTSVEIIHISNFVEICAENVHNHVGM